MKLFLVGDSTCQAYGPDMAPQQGWGGYFTDISKAQSRLS